MRRGYGRRAVDHPARTLPRRARDRGCSQGPRRSGLSRFAADQRTLLCAIVLLSGGCGKFQQARECGTFVQTVNAWLTGPEAQSVADAGASSDPKQVAEQARQTAQHYAELSKRLSALHIQSED